MMKAKLPPTVAYCWLYGIELSKKQIEAKGCTDPDKQSDPSGLCKHIQFYGQKIRRRNYLNISELCEKAHTNAKNKGFWDKPREFGTMIALIHSELSEALEADRHHDKENRAEELADVAIRLFDLCGGLGIDLENAIYTKMAVNECRPQMHNKQY